LNLFSARNHNSLFYALFLLATLFGIVSCADQPGESVCTIPPNPPNELSFEPVDQGLMVSWPPVPGASKYTLFWGQEKSEYRRFVETKSSAVIIKGIQAVDLIYFAVTAASAHIESRFSHETPYVYDTDPKNAPLHIQKAIQFGKHGDFEEALLHLSAAIKLDPQNSDYYRERAKLRVQLGFMNEANKDLAIAEATLQEKAEIP